jgi:hypothetical protein
VGSTTQEEEYLTAERRVENGPTPPHEMHDPEERHDVGSWALTEVHPSTINRISWGAIFAGTVVAFVVQILFSVLGLAIGLTIVEPMTGQAPWEGIGMVGCHRSDLAPPGWLDRGTAVWYASPSGCDAARCRRLGTGHLH